MVVTLTPRPWPLSDLWVSGRGSCREIGPVTLGCLAAMFPAEIFPRGWDRQILIWLPWHSVWHLAKRCNISLLIVGMYITKTDKETKQKWQQSKECMCSLQNIAAWRPRKLQWLSDRPRTKWSLCATMLRRWHKKAPNKTWNTLPPPPPPPLLVVMRIYVALAIFQSYHDLDRGDNQSLKT